MTDRENLELTAEQSEVLKTYVQNKILDFLFSEPWQPTNRACFDKPDGVAIEHWETVDPVMWGFGFGDKKETL